MNREVLTAASFYNRKVYENPTYAQLPKQTKQDVKTLCACLAEKIHGVFMVGFYEDGGLFFEAQGEADDFNYDDVGAQLEIERVKTQEKELIRALQLWFVMYKTEDGRQARAQLLRGEEQ